MLSGRDQQAVELMVMSANESELEEIRLEAERTLSLVRSAMGRRLSPEDSKAADLAIEALVRIECRALGKGWWFRAKRRVQLTQLYLGV